MDAVEQSLSSLHPSRRSTLTSQQLALTGRRKSIGVKRDGKEFWEAHTTYRRGVTPDSLRPYRVSKGAITSKIKHAIKHKTSPARLAQLLHNCCSPH